VTEGRLLFAEENLGGIFGLGPLLSPNYSGGQFFLVLLGGFLNSFFSPCSFRKKTHSL